MNTRLSFFAILALLLGSSVSAQDKFISPVDPPTPQSDLVTVQDDNTGNFLIISLNSGEYKFFRCRDQVSISGIGSVKIDGCSVSFQDLKADRRVLASLNICAQEGKAAVETFSPNTVELKEFFSDNDMRNSTADCFVTPGKLSGR